jgi:hypothetical protein
VVKAHLIKTLFTQNNAVLNFPLPAFRYGYARNSILSSQADAFATYGAPATPSVFSILPIRSNEDSSVSKSHNSSPPLCTWRKDEMGNYWYAKDGEWTGIRIEKKTYLRLPLLNTHSYSTKVLKLERPAFLVTFSPRWDISITIYLAGTPILKEAQKLAESYYKEWLKVNSMKVDT